MTSPQDEDVTDELVRKSLGDLLSARQLRPLPVPMQNPATLPLRELDPEVFERLVAELITGYSNRVHFYGRRGQQQYGLDIVEYHTEDRPTLYQVKRFQELGPSTIATAVEEYAGEARPSAERRFNPNKFVVVTSAAFDFDTRNVDELHRLDELYRGDLELDVWGLETLSRLLRSRPWIVNAVMGPQWAQAWCGVTPTPDQLALPSALALTRGPADALGLTDILKSAAALVETDPRSASNLFRNIADIFDSKGFPAHASSIRIDEARALIAAEDRSAAFDVLFGVALEQIRTRSTLYRPSPKQLNDTAVTNEQRAKAVLLALLDSWPDQGLNLAGSIAALQLLEASDDPSYSELCCMTAEQALVDGLFDFMPPRAAILPVGTEDLAAALDELLRMTRTLTASDPVLRARIECCVADAALPLSAPPEDIEAAYSPITNIALASGYLRANGLAKSRRAYAHALRGDLEPAQAWWTSSITDSSESGFYGDVFEVMRSISDLQWDHGRLAAPMADLSAALPDRRKLLAQRIDPELVALSAAHQDQLADAFGDTRRFLWEARIAGQRALERDAMALFADVLSAANEHRAAIIAYLSAGKGDDAAKLAANQYPVDVGYWIGTKDPRRRSAIIRTIGAQAMRYPGELVPVVAAVLLEDARELWNHISVMDPCPEWDAVKALISLGHRIPGSAVNDIVTLASPTVENPNLLGADSIAELLVNAYCAVPARRADIADVLGQRMTREERTPELWQCIEQIPQSDRAELIPYVEAAAASGRRDPVACAAKWGLGVAKVQEAARRACADLLRRPLHHDPNSAILSANEGAAVTLLLALLNLDEARIVNVDKDLLRADHAQRAAGTSTVETADPQSRAHSERDEGAKEADDADGLPVEIVEIAAGPREQLAAAVGEKLMAIAENSLEGSGTRVRTIYGISRLAPRLRPDQVAGIARRLERIFQNPAHSPIDVQTMSWNHPLSRTHMDFGETHLRAVALASSAKAYHTACKPTPPEPPADSDPELVAHLIAGVTEVLARNDDSDRRSVADGLINLVDAGDVPRQVLIPLLGDRDWWIRARAVQSSEPSPELLATLARDASPYVRAAVADSDPLPEEIRNALSEDPDPEVAQRAKRA
jgi:hypothetical protein